MVSILSISLPEPYFSQKMHISLRRYMTTSTIEPRLDTKVKAAGRKWQMDSDIVTFTIDYFQLYSLAHYDKLSTQFIPLLSQQVEQHEHSI